MHIPITVSNKKIPKGTRIIKKKLTKKLTQKEEKKNTDYMFGGGRRRVADWVEGEGSPTGWKAKGHRKCHELKRRWMKRHRRAKATPTIGDLKRCQWRSELLPTASRSVSISELKRRH